jgi:hypothetical protein
VIAACRKDKGAAWYLVVCNFDIMGKQHFETDLSNLLENAGPVNCVDLLSGTEYSFPGARVDFVLPASGALVLMCRPDAAT